MLRSYGRLPLDEALGELRFLHLWHVLGHLVWAVNHGYGARTSALRDQLAVLLGPPGT